MLKIIDDKTVMSYRDAEKKYKGYLILVIDQGNNKGNVYAISDGKDRGKISDLQMDFYDKNIMTLQLNELGGSNSTLVTRKCEIL
jgi:hypothetical protein